MSIGASTRKTEKVCSGEGIRDNLFAPSHLPSPLYPLAQALEFTTAFCKPSKHTKIAENYSSRKQTKKPQPQTAFC